MQASKNSSTPSAKRVKSTAVQATPSPAPASSKRAASAPIQTPTPSKLPHPMRHTLVAADLNDRSPKRVGDLFAQAQQSCGILYFLLARCFKLSDRVFAAATLVRCNEPSRLVPLSPELYDVSYPCDLGSQQSLVDRGVQLLELTLASFPEASIFLDETTKLLGRCLLRGC
jgi:hypothetical protein